MNYSAPEQMGIGRHVGTWWTCPVLDTGASFLNSWIPVFPGMTTRGKLRRF